MQLKTLPFSTHYPVPKPLPHFMILVTAAPHFMIPISLLVCRLPEQNTIDGVACQTDIYFVIVLEAGKSKIKVLTDSGSGENPLLGLQRERKLSCYALT